jgi:hypothetical protein
MATITISGQVFYAAPPWASEVPAAGVEVSIYDNDFPAPDDPIFQGPTDSEGKFDGESSDWDDEAFDALTMTIQISERQYGMQRTPWGTYNQPPSGARARVVLPWGPPNLKNFGDVLVVAGRNINGNHIYGDDIDEWDYGNRLMELLYTMPPGSTPVFRGSHDFWVTVPVPKLDHVSFNRAQDSLPVFPWHRPYGGFIHMQEPPDITSGESISGKMNTLLHEIGHRWLVPGDITFDDNGTTIRMLTEAEFWRAINDDTPFDGSTMLGRDESHWSPFWLAHRSVMDAASWTRSTVDGVARWTGTSHAGDAVHLDGLPDFVVNPKFDPLEQVIMGMLDKNDAYPETGNRTFWIEPRVTAGIPYFAGMFIAFANDDYIELGYDTDHRRIVVTQNGTELASMDSGNELQFQGTHLEIERVGDQYRFSAGPEQPGGCVAAIIDWFFSLIGAQPIRRSTERVYFHTITDSRPPIAAGVLARTIRPVVVEAAFKALKVTTPEGEIAIGADVVTHDGDLASLPANEWRKHAPASGPMFRFKDGEHRIFLPRVLMNGDGTFTDQPAFGRGVGENGFFDDVPKITFRPIGDFRMTAAARIHRITLMPRSGGSSGLTIWGTEKSAPVSGIKLSQAVRDKQVAPPDDTHKVAYIIVAKEFSDVSDDFIARVDGMRRAADAAFEVACDGNRHLNSSLD